MGYRGHSDWRDMSEYVVHFSRDVPGGVSAYGSMLSILASGKLGARSRFGAARKLDALGDTQKSACFSEIPLDRLDRLVERRSRYGIGFRQDVLVQAGGGRVWYLDSETEPALALQSLIGQKLGPPMDVSSPLWNLTPFIDFPGTYGSTEFHFEWEREWRVPGGLAFAPQQVPSCSSPVNFILKRDSSLMRLSGQTAVLIIAVHSLIRSGQTSRYKLLWQACRQVRSLRERETGYMMEIISISGELGDDSPLAIVEVSVSAFPAQSPPVVRTVEAVIDTGSSWCVITEELARETGILDTAEIPSHQYAVSAREETPQYAATIAVRDFTLTTLVYANLVPPPNATYRVLLGCAVLWHGHFQYDGMSSPKRFTLELPRGEFGTK